jgi:hypothetical protein
LNLEDNVGVVLLGPSAGIKKVLQKEHNVSSLKVGANGRTCSKTSWFQLMEKVVETYKCLWKEKLLSYLQISYCEPLQTGIKQ